MSTTDTSSSTIPAAPEAQHDHDAERPDPAADRRAQLDAARADHDVKHQALWEKYNLDASELYTLAMQNTAELCAEYDARVRAIVEDSHR